MKNIYKTRVHRVLVNIVFGAGAALLVAFIASIWLKPLALRVLIFAAVYAFYIWTVIIGNMIVIETDGTTLTVSKGKKKDEYPIAATHFRAKTVSSSGDTECTLYVTRQGGEEETIDCELIGITQFRRLLDDLGFGGEDSVTKLDTGHSN
ncbi:MAG: hypothetical protein ACTTKL_04010 [Treponema sp.]